MNRQAKQNIKIMSFISTYYFIKHLPHPVFDQVSKSTKVDISLASALTVVLATHLLLEVQWARLINSYKISAQTKKNIAHALPKIYLLLGAALIVGLRANGYDPELCARIEGIYGIIYVISGVFVRYKFDKNLDCTLIHDPYGLAKIISGPGTEILNDITYPCAVLDVSGVTFVAKLLEIMRRFGTQEAIRRFVLSSYTQVSKRFAQQLSKLSGLQQIDFGPGIRYFTAQDLRLILEALPQTCTEIHDLIPSNIISILASSRDNHGNAVHLLAAFRHLQQLDYINLGGATLRNLPKQVAIQLLAVITTDCTQVRLSNAALLNLDEEVFSSLIKFLTSLRNLTRLNIADNNLDNLLPGQWLQVHKLFRQIAVTCTWLNLSNTNIAIAHADVKAVLKSLINLKGIILSGNNLERLSAKNLAALLSSITTECELIDLLYTNFGAFNTASLVVWEDFFFALQKLQDLNIDESCLDIDHLVDAIAAKQLRSLYIRGNNQDSSIEVLIKRMRALTGILRNNPGLQVFGLNQAICIRFNNYTANEQVALLTVLREVFAAIPSNLRILKIKDNFTEFGSLASIREFMDYQYSLVSRLHRLEYLVFKADLYRYYPSNNLLLDNTANLINITANSCAIIDVAPENLPGVARVVQLKTAANHKYIKRQFTYHSIFATCKAAISIESSNQRSDNLFIRCIANKIILNRIIEFCMSKFRYARHQFFIQDIPKRVLKSCSYNA